MITLITGVPGSGKTLNTLQMVQEEWVEAKDKDGKPFNRNIYYRGIKDLKLDWQEITDDQVKEWFNFPPGSIFVIDEVQQVFPRRSPNIKAPEGVSRLDTHRHHGYEFYLMTQKPKNFDHDVRGFVGRHYHYERAFGFEGTKQLRWEQACDDPSDYYKRQEAEVSRKRFNKKYYDVYSSASMHNVKKKIPKQLYVFAAACVLVLGLGISLVNSLASRTDPDASLGETSTSLNPLDYTSTLGPKKDEVQTTAEYMEERIPRVTGVPWSAPMFDEVRQVKTFPRPQCIALSDGSKCRCFTQQASPLSIPKDLCMSIVDGGYFNPYKEEPGGEQARADGYASAPPSVRPAPNTRIYEPPPEPRIIVLPSSQSTSPTIQPGRAYRSPASTVPVMPQAPSAFTRIQPGTPTSLQR